MVVEKGETGVEGVELVARGTVFLRKWRSLRKPQYIGAEKVAR